MSLIALFLSTKWSYRGPDFLHPNLTKTVVDLMTVLQNLHLPPPQPHKLSSCRLLCRPMKEIALDSTHGTNAYVYQLTTLTVIDEHGEGFPAAFCFSSHVTSQAWAYFLLSARKPHQCCPHDRWHRSVSQCMVSCDGAAFIMVSLYFTNTSLHLLTHTRCLGRRTS